ncbi:AI-2E family transporter [Pseudooceanicola sp. CBS1P-1]|uniref:AI-2E family transporter n=2 Tax=Paracoccaceae TaxID=31989 RepID=A0A6L7G3Z3_9RHOB|nr:AI-2E family transporter [Pseudooceanicola endophyticus]MXN18228.1 AI-2E family transporter [Pseudooceanicola albus]
MARNRYLQRIYVALSALAILFGFWSISLAKVVVLPIVLGLLIALTLAPFMRFLGRLRVPQALAAMLLIFSIGGASAYGMYMLRVPAQVLLEETPKIQTELRIKLWSVMRNVDKMQAATEELKQMASGGNNGNATDTRVIVQNGPSLLRSAAASAAGTGSTVIVALLLAMFLLASGGMFRHKFIDSFPDFASKRRAMRISRDVERQISRYLAAITVINAGLGLAIGGALHLMHMPYALLWGVAAFALNYLPYLGAVVGIAASGALALVTFDSTGQALLVPLTYMILTSLEGQILTPWVVGRHLQLNTPAVFLAVIFWAWLWGIAGALLAVPFLVMIKVVCDNVPELSVVARFLDGDDGPTLSRAERRRRRRARAEAARQRQALRSPAHVILPAETDPPIGAAAGHGPTPGLQPMKAPPRA